MVSMMLRHCEKRIEVHEWDIYIFYAQPARLKTPSLEYVASEINQTQCSPQR